MRNYVQLFNLKLPLSFMITANAIQLLFSSNIKVLLCENKLQELFYDIWS